jgi:diguanylate cyclase (GGDEF)-like protein
MSSNGGIEAPSLRGILGRVSRMREQIAKAWLVDVILDRPLADAERIPIRWACTELPELIGDILASVGDERSPQLSPEGMERAARLAQLRGGSPPALLAREVASLHAALLSALRDELPRSDTELQAEVAGRLAEVFGLVSGAAVDALFEQTDTGRDPLTGLSRSARMRQRLTQLVASSRRYEQPFAIVLLDIEGPGARGEADPVGREGVLTIVSAALRESIRLVDEAFRLDDDELCVLAPNQTAQDGERMAERLAGMLAELEAAGGLKITVSAGIVSCPEHGDDPDRLLRRADTAMWRARATGRLVMLGDMQDS